MTSSDVWDAESAEHYDESSAYMFEPDVLDPTVDFLAELAGDGPALELAVGTGRVAIPLADRGIAVSGIELSEPMVAKLRETRTDIPTVVGDMATTTVEGPFTLVYVVWNTAVPFHVGQTHVGLDTYDMTTQQGTSHHYRRHPDGTVTYGASNFRYIWPAECDLMAQLAGLELERRVADWDGSPFTSDSESHVSVWRKPESER